jgi:uncharacterized protein YecE (DUF72 family)
MVARRPEHTLFESDPDGNATPEPAARKGISAPLFDAELVRLGRQLPDTVFLGTSSWSFPGWRGIVYAGEHSEVQLARNGLTAYRQHPLLRAVGVDRSFYKPLTQTDYAAYARQVAPDFRFAIKAPALIADAVVRSERGAPGENNPRFLDAEAAAELFVAPALHGLRHADGTSLAGPLIFQLSPLPAPMLRGDAAPAFIERLGAFLDRLPRSVDGVAPLYAVELRNPGLLTPRLVRTLRETGARLCLGLHSRMPAAARQSAALRAMDAEAEEGDAWRMKGPLIVRWLLHAGFEYEQAKRRYAPFDRIIDADIASRGTVSHLVHVALRSRQPAFVIVGNKAEGSAPLSCIALAKAIVGNAA